MPADFQFPAGRRRRGARHLDADRGTDPALSRPALPVRRRAAEGRRHHRAGAGGDGRHRRRHREGAAAVQPRPRRERPAAARRDGARLPPRPARPVRGRRARAAHRLLQRREPAAGASGVAAAGDRRADGARRGTAPRRAAAARRRRASSPRSAAPAACWSRCGSCRSRGRRRPATSRGCRRRISIATVLGLRGRRQRADGPRLRTGAARTGDARAGRGPAEARIEGRGAPGPAAAAARDRHRRSRAHGDHRDGRRALPSELQPPAARRSRLRVRRA